MFGPLSPADQRDDFRAALAREFGYDPTNRVREPASRPQPDRPSNPFLMKFLLLAAAILAMICTVVTTLTAVVFVMSMGANATPEQIRALKLWMAGLSLLGCSGIVVGNFLMRAGEHGWAAGAAILPAVIMMLIFIVAMLIK